MLDRILRLLLAETTMPSIFDMKPPLFPRAPRLPWRASWMQISQSRFVGRRFLRLSAFVLRRFGLGLLRLAMGLRLGFALFLVGQLGIGIRFTLGSLVSGSRFRTLRRMVCTSLGRCGMLAAILVRGLVCSPPSSVAPCSAAGSSFDPRPTMPSILPNMPGFLASSSFLASPRLPWRPRPSGRRPSASCRRCRSGRRLPAFLPSSALPSWPLPCRLRGPRLPWPAPRGRPLPSWPRGPRLPSSFPAFSRVWLLSSSRPSSRPSCRQPLLAGRRRAVGQFFILETSSSASAEVMVASSP